MDKVLKYLTYFEYPNNKFYHIGEISRIRDNGTPILNLYPHEYSGEVWEFIKTLYACNFIQPFDWGLWQDEAAKYIDYPDLLDSADLETVIKLLTTHVRKDRF